MEANSGRWFAVHVRRNAEVSVSAALASKGYEYFLPTRIGKPAGSDGGASAHEPLFPGYVFCRLDGERKPRVVTTPGVIRIVGYGRVPIAIDDQEIVSLQKIVRARVPVQAMAGLRAGDSLTVKDGPLSGVVGSFRTVNRRHQLIVSVTLLGRSVLVELEPEWVRVQ
ncbi:MAG: hypothetical protein JO217_08475 [Acidobacteriaceae bacterium]|nr:hypothetical protein [Acidobacteriaceae bacterium]